MKKRKLNNLENGANEGCGLATQKIKRGTIHTEVSSLHQCASNTTKSNYVFCKAKKMSGSIFCKKHSKRLTPLQLAQLLREIKEEEQKGIFRVLTGEIKKQVHHHYNVNFPRPIDPRPLANNYDRIEIGDHGAYVQIDQADINLNMLSIPKEQRFRLHSEASPYVKYIWWQGPQGQKVYQQTKPVRYANYVPGKFYSDLRIVEEKRDRKIEIKSS